MTLYKSISGHAYFNPRSPRGERPDDGVRKAMDVSFQSTLPARGATKTGQMRLSLTGISIHAPREGSDLYALWYSAEIAISIHAPREGSDTATGTAAKNAEFQSTLPARGATADNL